MTCEFETSASSAVPRELSILYIPDAVPIPWNDATSSLYGVGIAAINNGLNVFVEPYNNMAIGDVVEVYWDTSSGVPEGRIDVTSNNINKQLELNLPETYFTEGDFQPFYRVRRISGSIINSDVRNIRVKLSSPGGKDPDPSTPNNENLSAPQLPDGLHYVNAELAAQGIDITIAPYPNMGAYDHIDFSWGGQRLSYTVQPQEVGKKLTVSVTELDILTAGDGSIMLMYQVIDAGANRSDGWSLVTTVDVYAADSQLDAPIVKDAVNDILNIGDLNGNDTVVQVLVTTSNFKVGDTVSLFWKGWAAAGGSIDWDVSKVVTNAPSLMEFTVPYSIVTETAQGYAVVFYSLKKSDSTEQTSRRAQIQIVGTEDRLPPPTVVESVNGVLSAEVPQATVVISAYPGMAKDDRVDMVWEGNTSGVYFDWIQITSETVNHTLTFLVPSTQIAKNSNVMVGYTVTRANGNPEASEKLSLLIGEHNMLPAPIIDEAIGTQLNPANVPNGATVRVPATAALQTGDLVIIRWAGTVGAGSKSFEQTISSSGSGQDLIVITSFELIQANVGHTITLDYEVRRATGVAETSPAAVYDVSTEVNTGTLKVMGARSNNSNFRGEESGGQRLVALDSDSLEPVDAIWRYEGETQTVSGTSFRDTHPECLLHVSTATDQVTLNATNLCGNMKAFVARLNAGNVVAWGDEKSGGKPSGTISSMTDIVALAGNHDAFAALRGNGSVVAWGNNGGSVPTNIAIMSDIVQVTGSKSDGLYPRNSSAAFAALRSDGHVVAWGDAASGGNVPNDIAVLDDITEVIGSKAVFVARRANGHVIAWGNAAYGGAVPSDIASMSDIVTICGGYDRVAALRANGHVVAWGQGDVPADIAMMDDIVAITSNESGFAARRSNGSVIAWGGSSITVPSAIAERTDVILVAASINSFATLHSDGSVSAWGSSDLGGEVPLSIQALTDVVALTGNLYGGFAVLRANGTVMAWGEAPLGGDTTSVSSELYDIRAVYGSGQAFAALRSDGHVVTWGLASYGGDNSSVSNSLNGFVSYEATPTSRGIAQQLKDVTEF